MTDPKNQAEKQLTNIEESTGMSLDDFAKSIASTDLQRHGEIVGHLKSEFGLGHGNANLIATRFREIRAGGPAADDELLANQYSGAKAPLRPIMEAAVEAARGFGDDVEVVVQKTGVSLRRARQFALVQAPSSKRVQIGLNLGTTPGSDRIEETSGMCSHRVDVTSLDEIDGELVGWMRQAYEQRG
jgi:hypothetical protein